MFQCWIVCFLLFFTFFKLFKRHCLPSFLWDSLCLVNFHKVPVCLPLTYTHIYVCSLHPLYTFLYTLTLLHMLHSNIYPWLVLFFSSFCSLFDFFAYFNFVFIFFFVVFFSLSLSQCLCCLIVLDVVPLRLNNIVIMRAREGESMHVCVCCFVWHQLISFVCQWKC